MKIKLLNGAEHGIKDICNKGNTLEIVLSAANITAEEAEKEFQNRENLKRIEVYGTTKLTTMLLDYVVLSEVKLKSSAVTVVLTKEADVTEQRITAAYAAATEALSAAEEMKTEKEQIIANMDYLAMELGVEL